MVLRGGIDEKKSGIMTELKWQPIETAPKDGTEIIVMYVNIATQIVHAACWIEDEYDPSETGWWSNDWNEIGSVIMKGAYAPTHWMPLPKRPE